MNKTANYNLNQWVKADRVLMEDFNTDNAKLDAAIKAAMAKASEEHVHTGSFVGNGIAGRVFQMPWEPKLALLIGEVAGVTQLGILTPDCFLLTGAGVSSTIYKDDDASGLSIRGSAIVTKNYFFNTKEKTYYYVALR